MLRVASPCYYFLVTGMSILLQKIQTHYVKPTYTDVKVGDTVRVYTRIKEGEKERTQYFEGLVIRRRGGVGTSATFTVRRIASGVGVERTFALHSPLIERIRIQRGAKVRRARLYTMRGLTGKAARLTEQPVKQADRERTHAWPALFGVKTKTEVPETDTAEQKSAVVEDQDSADTAPEPDTPPEQKPEDTEPSKADTQGAPEAQGSEQNQSDKDAPAKGGNEEAMDEKAGKPEADAKSKKDEPGK